VPPKARNPYAPSESAERSFKCDHPRLLRIVRRSTGSVVTWRRAQMVLLSARGMSVTEIAG